MYYRNTQDQELPPKLMAFVQDLCVLIGLCGRYLILHRLQSNDPGQVKIPKSILYAEGLSFHRWIFCTSLSPDY